MKHLKLFLTVALLLFAITSVGAQDVTTVVWWTESGDEVDDFLIPLLADAFNAEHDDVQLEIIAQESLNDVNRTALQAGAAPDIIQTPGAAFIAEFVDAGQILPMTSLADQYGWKDKLLPLGLQLRRPRWRALQHPHHLREHGALLQQDAIRRHGLGPADITSRD